MTGVPSTSNTIERSDLPILPPDWRWVQFSETCDRVSVGHVGPTTEFFTEAHDGICFLRSQNVRPGKLELDNALSITPEFHKKLKKSQLRAGDILFVRVGANRGDCCVVPSGVGELNCANIVFARPKHSTGFHAYFFQSDLGRNLLLSASVGAAQGVINTGSVATMPVPLPPLPVQQRIAGILSAYDELIENNQRRIKILETMARNLYREWFVHFRFPGHENRQRVASPLGEIPQGWSAGKLGDHCQIIPGYAFKSADWQSEGVPVFKIKNIQSDNTVDTSNTDFVSEQISQSTHNKFVARNGDILIAMTGATAGKLGKLRINGRALLNQRVAKIQPEASYNALVWSAISTEESKTRFFLLADGAAQPNMSGSQIENVDFIYPPLELAEAFSILADPIYDLVDTLYHQILNLRRTRDLLLPRLLSGQITLPEAADDLTEVTTHA